jgi:hypothetical protein
MGMCRSGPPYSERGDTVRGTALDDVPLARVKSPTRGRTTAAAGVATLQCRVPTGVWVTARLRRLHAFVLYWRGASPLHVETQAAA